MEHKHDFEWRKGLRGFISAEDCFDCGISPMAYIRDLEERIARAENELDELRDCFDRIWRLTNLPFDDNDRRAIQREALSALQPAPKPADSPEGAAS